MSRRLGISAIAALALAVAAPAAAGAAAPPPVPHGRAAIVIDAATGARLYAANADAHLPIASTTKMMTALLTLERVPLTRMLTAPAYTPSPAESRIDLVAGEQMTVGDLLRALLLPSANDAAVTLADGVGGTQPAFVALMNARARALGLTETHYENPIGLDSPANYSSARDLAALAAHLLRNSTFAGIVRLPAARLTSGAHPRTVVNRNTLVGRYPFVTGVKTGHTTLAGDVLVASASQGGASVVSAVLAEPDEATQNTDTLALLRYGLSQFSPVTPVRAGARVATATVKYFDGDHVPLRAAAGVTFAARRGARVTAHIDAPRQLTGPLPAGRRVGSATVYYDGRLAGRVPVETAAAVRGAGLLRKLWEPARPLLAALALLSLIGAAAVGLRARRRRPRPLRRTAHDHHRHAQRGNRQDARRAELPARAPAPRGRADVDGRRQGRQRRPRA